MAIERKVFICHLEEEFGYEVPGRGDVLESYISNETVEFIFSIITDRQKAVVRMYCLEQKRQADIGSYLTAPYYVKFGNISAAAYCVQPSKTGPDDGTYTVTKLSDGKTLAKVCYYGTKAAGDEGFFAEKHPDFSAGKRFIITHMAAAYMESQITDHVLLPIVTLIIELIGACAWIPTFLEYTENKKENVIHGSFKDIALIRKFRRKTKRFR